MTLSVGHMFSFQKGKYLAGITVVIKIIKAKDIIFGMNQYILARHLKKS